MHQFSRVPAGVDRPVAWPGQDLYRAVLAVHDDRLCALELSGGEVVETCAAMGEVVAVRNDTCLLVGELVLYLTGGRTLRLSYNTVSQELVEGVVDHLRTRISPTVTGSQPLPPALADHWFRHLAAEHARRSATSALVYCEERGRAFRDPSGQRRRSRGLMALETGSELALITRGELPYATSRVYLPHTAVFGHALHDEPTSRNRTRRLLRVTVPGHAMEFDLSGEGAPLLALLEALEAQRSGEAEHAQRPG